VLGVTEGVGLFLGATDVCRGKPNVLPCGIACPFGLDRGVTVVLSIFGVDSVL